MRSACASLLVSIRFNSQNRPDPIQIHIYLSCPEKAWNPESLPAWFDEHFYCKTVKPRLSAIRVQTIRCEISVSEPYALRIRAGRCVPGKSQAGPVLAINSLVSETEKVEPRGVANLLIGLFGTIRNPLAHNPKIEWDMSEQDALDILTMASLIHRKLDKAYRRKAGAP
jgi:Protein of unknown function (Hypoth_ymh)